MRLKSLFLAGTLGLFSFASQAPADVLYSDGAVNGTIGGWTITFGAEVSDSFTLTQASTVTGVTFGAWTSGSNSTISSIQFGIVSAPNTYTLSGTATVTNGSVIPGSGYGGEYTVRSDSFATGNINLAAGTYYLVLGNAIGTGVSYWDINDGASTASWSQAGSIAAESFQILGVASAVPEPSTWAMMILGFFGVGFLAYRKKTTLRFA